MKLVTMEFLKINGWESFFPNYFRVLQFVYPCSKYDQSILLPQAFRKLVIVFCPYAIKTETGESAMGKVNYQNNGN